MANTGFTSGGTLLTVGNPNAIAGVGGLYGVVSPTVGFSVDDTGVLSGDSSGISNLTDGPNDVIVNQRIGSIPGSGLPEERMIDLNVHKLSDTGAQVVILIGKDPADTALTDNDIFPNGRGVSGDNLGFEFEDVGIEGVDTTGLTVANVTYDSSTNEFSIGAELTEGDISDNYIVVTMTASNVRGTHVMTVNVGVVDRIVIEASNQVSPNENIAAAADYTGPIAEAAGLVNSGAAGNVTFQCSVVGGANQGDFSASATGTGCNVNLNAAIGDAATSKEVQIEIVHTATAPYTQRLLAPFNGQQPDGSGDSIPDTVITANITVWKAEPGAAQGNNANSDGPVSGVSFDPPANPDASVDFQDGTETWAVVGTPEEGLQVGEDGVVSGNVSDRPGDDADTGIYIVTITANFMHGLLAGLLPVELELTVSDFSAPTTLNVIAADANGNVIVRVEGAAPVTIGNSATEVMADTNRLRIEIIAAPNAGHHVDSFSVGGIDACSGDAFTGHGGYKSCVLPNRTEDVPINVTVAFAAGALHPDLPESGDVNAESDIAAFVSCYAFGGIIKDDSVSDNCLQFGDALDEDSSTACTVENSQDAPNNCAGVFNSVRNCNLANQPSSSVDTTAGTAACGGACSAGEVARGGSCVTAPPTAVEVLFTQSQVQVFRALDGSAVTSGDYVGAGAMLSVVATPSAGDFVAGWNVTCEDKVQSPINSAGGVGAPAGTFDDFGPKTCYVRATVALDIMANFSAPPQGFNVPSEADLGGLAGGASAADHQANCEALGGIYGATGTSGGALACSNLSEAYDAANFAFEECTFEVALGQDPNCGTILRAVRQCIIRNRPVSALGESAGEVVIPYDIGTAETDALACGAVCDPGKLPAAGGCKDATSSSASATEIEVGSEIEMKAERHSSISSGLDYFVPAGESVLQYRAAAAYPDDLGFSKKKAALTAADEPFFQRVADKIPDALPSEIPTSGNVPETRASCEALLGDFNTTGDGFCLDIAASTTPFCQVGSGCQILFNRVRDCNLMFNQRGGGFRPATETSCGAVCENGLTAIGNKCASENGGDVTDDLEVGELPGGIPTSGNVPETRASCEALLGDFNTTGDGFCLDIAASTTPFCQIGSGCQILFNRVRDCNLMFNQRGGGFRPATESSCGAICEHGTAARGNKCVKPAARDGINITPPATERGGLEATSEGATVTVGIHTPLALNQLVTITATPVDGYYLARWTGSCANAETDGNSATSASSVAYSPDKQTCILQRSGADGSDAAALSAGAVFEYGLLPSDVRQFADATVIETPTSVHCEALGGNAGVTLGSGNNGVNYCDNYNEDTPNGSTGGVEEDENIEDQCWLFGGGDVVSDPTAENNVQLCRNALAHTIQCNKLNRKSASNLPAPVSRECGSGQTDTQTCAAVASARAVDSPSADLLCGGACEDGMIARGGTCVSAAAAASGDDSDAIGGAY